MYAGRKGNRIMKKLRNGHYIMATAQEVNALADEMEGKVKQYGWEARTVMPYSGCPMEVTQIIREMREYAVCTTGSKYYLIALANGLVDIMNAWERQELEPKIEIRLHNSGKVVKVGAEMVQELISEGYAEAV